MELFWDTLVGAEVARIATALIKVVVLGVLASLALSWVARRTDRMADRLHIEPLIAELAITALKVFLFLFVLISALSSLGVQTNTLLAAVGAALEAEFGSPQNVEGCVVGEDVFVFQSRPQPL